MATPPNDLVAQLATPAFGSVTVLTVDDLSADERSSLPAWWHAVLERDGGEAVTRAVDEWESSLPGFAPEFLQRLRSNGVGMYLGRSGTRLVLVYAIKTDADKNPYAPWYGYPPVEGLSHPRIDIARLPVRLTDFYRSLHRRFEYGMAIRNGIVPVEELAAVGEYALENMEYFLTDRRPDLGDVMAFFVGYGSRYICVELSDDLKHSAGWLWAENSLAPCEDVWQEVDGWLVEFTDW